MSTACRKFLVILTPGFPSDEMDTTCLPMQQQLVLAFNRVFPEWTIKILSFQYPFEQKTYKWFGNEVTAFGGRNRGNFRRLLLRRRVLAHLRDLIKVQPIDGLFSFWFGECAVAGKKFADKHKLKHYCWLLGQDARADNPYPRRIKMPGNELIALSDFLQAEYEKNHHVKPVEVIVPGVEINSAGINMRDIDILGAGSLIALKRFDLFLDIVLMLKNEFPDLKAMIIGEGPERKKLDQQIRIKGLQANIQLAGKLPYNEVLEHMRRAKILLHPSSYEGFSGVCLEALGAGAHVISFCKPMNTRIDRWTIVESNKEMIECALSVLRNPAACVNREPIYHINETAKKIIRLFDDPTFI